MDDTHPAPLLLPAAPPRRVIPLHDHAPQHPPAAPHPHQHRHHHHNDLSPLFQLNPLGSIHFLIRCITSGLWIGGITLIPTVYVLYQTYHSHIPIDTALRYYHIFRLLIYTIQFPLRLALLQRLRHAAAQPNRQAVIHQLNELTHMQIWNLNHIIGQLVYVSLAFSCSFALNTRIRFFTTADTYEASTLMLYRLLVVNVLTFFGHMSASFVWMNNIFADQWFDMQSRSRGANTETINKHTVTTKYTNIRSISSVTEAGEHASDDDSVPALIEDSCIICFNEYEASDNIRVLQCMHAYHTQCIDVWLQAKAHCPLCSTALNKKND